MIMALNHTKGDVITRESCNALSCQGDRLLLLSTLFGAITENVSLCAAECDALSKILHEAEDTICEFTCDAEISGGEA